MSKNVSPFIEIRTKLYPLILSAVLLVSCSNHREEYIKAHPELSAERVEKIRKGTISIGMTKEEVQAAWGERCWCCRGNRSSSWGDTWEYNIFGCGTYGIGKGTYVFFDTSGRVKGFSD